MLKTLKKYDTEKPTIEKYELSIRSWQGLDCDCLNVKISEEAKERL